MEAKTAPAAISSKLRMPSEIQKERKAGKRTAYRLPATALLVAFLPAASAAWAQDAPPPPKGLLRDIAANGSLFQQELNRYTYRQRFHFFELDRYGVRRGDYLEVRDVTFNPDGERIDRFIKGPIDRLDRMSLTEEDFRDLREVQPFVLTRDTLWLYETNFLGDDVVDGRPCYVYRIRPRQTLDGQRLLDGHIWVGREALQVVQVAGLPVPQMPRTEGGNLFPRFTTTFQPVDGKFWFPIKTIAEDTLAFSSGLQRVRYEIDFAEYKRFSAETKVTFGEPIEEPQP